MKTICFCLYRRTSKFERNVEVIGDSDGDEMPDRNRNDEEERSDTFAFGLRAANYEFAIRVRARLLGSWFIDFQLVNMQKASDSRQLFCCEY